MMIAVKEQIMRFPVLEIYYSCFDSSLIKQATSDVHPV